MQHMKIYIGPIKNFVKRAFKRYMVYGTVCLDSPIKHKPLCKHVLTSMNVW